MTDSEKITKRAAVVSLGTMTSRILGLARLMAIATMLTSGMRDIFFFAFTIPNLFRRLLGEGALSAAFIPVFNDYLAKKKKEEAFRVANTTFHLLFLILVLLTIIGILIAPLIVHPTGFNAEGKILTLGLLRAMLPFMIFICLAALIMGILNSFGNFAVPAFAPCILNIFIIASAFTICNRFRYPVMGLALGVILGGAGQLLFQVPFAVKKGFSFLPRIDYRHPAVKKIGLLFLPAALGLAVTPINTFVDRLLASLPRFCPPGSVSALWVSNRLFQFPLALFGIAIATAIFPTMSRQATLRKIEELKETLSHALGLAFFTTVPATIGLIILRVPIIRLLFQYKKFTAYDTSATAWALLFYSLGLFAFGAVIILVRVFYSLKDTKTPAKLACFVVMSNIILDLILMRPLAQGGLALATSLVAFLNMSLLFWLLRRRIGRLGGRKILTNFIRILIASSIMGGICWLVARAFEPHVVTIGFRVLQVGVTIVAGLVTLVIASTILRIKEMRTIWEIVTGRTR
ncbi:putative lipid II flippase MurJ [subsurface metagenome]